MVHPQLKDNELPMSGALVGVESHNSSIYLFIHPSILHSGPAGGCWFTLLSSQQDDPSTQQRDNYPHDPAAM
jgi:hypothetical protein